MKNLNLGIEIEGLFNHNSFNTIIPLDYHSDTKRSHNLIYWKIEKP